MRSQDVLLLFLNADINECLSEPCQYGGTCYDAINGYACTCMRGYEGSDCETGLYDHVS